MSENSSPTRSRAPRTRATDARRHVVALAAIALALPLTAVAALPATAAAGDFTVTPSALEFGEVALGDTGTIDVTITNTSQTTQTPNIVGGGLWPAEPFSGNQSCAGVTLAPGEGCQYHYRFSPTTMGIAEQSTQITVDDVQFPITFSGEGVTPFRVSATTLEFGDVQVGDRETVAVTITNRSSVHQEPLLAGGGATAPFQMVTTCTDLGLEPGATCAMEYTFTPTAIGAVSADTGANIGGIMHDITMTGNGIAAPVETAAVDDEYRTAFETVLEVDAPGVLANDTLADDDFTLEVVEAPASGTVELADDGSFEYTPVAGFSGTVEFGYRIVDERQRADVTATVTITVAAKAATPSATPRPTATETSALADTGVSPVWPITAAVALAMAGAALVLLRRRTRARG